MPRRKRAKCIPTLSASRNKKYGDKLLYKGGQRSNVSNQRSLKSKTHHNQVDDIKSSVLPGGIPTLKGNEEEEEDAFGISPAYLCECTLQTQDDSVASEIDPSKEYGLKKRTVKSKLFKKKEPPHYDKNDINNCDQEFNPAYLCESILQSEDTSVVSKPDLSKEYHSNQILLEKNLLKAKKVRRNGKKHESSKVNSFGKEYSLAYLCESKSQSKDTSVVLKSDPPKENCSRNSLQNGSQCTKIKLPRNSIKLATNKRNNQGQKYSPAQLCKTILQSEGTSIVSEPGLSKEYYSKQIILQNNGLKAKKIQCSNKKQNSNEVSNYGHEHSPAYLCESKSQLEKPVVSEFGLPKDNCSGNSLLDDQWTKRKLRHNGIQGKNNNNSNLCQVYSPAELSESILQSEETSVVLEPDLSKECYSKQSLLQNNLSKSKKGRRNNKKHNNDLLIPPAYLCESQLQLEKPVVSESDTPKVSCSANSSLKGNQLKKRKPRLNGKELKNNEKNGNGPAELCERILQSEETSVVLEPDLSKECYSKQSLLQNNLSKAKKGRRNNKKHNNDLLIPPAYLCESQLQLEKPVVSESDTPKVSCSANSSLKGNQLKKRKPRLNGKELKNNEKNGNGPAELCERILQSEETSVVLEPDLSKECYSKQSLLQNNLSKAKKGRRNNKKHNNDLLIPPAYLCESQLQLEKPVVSESDPPKVSCSANSSLKGNQFKKRKPRLNGKELKNNEKNGNGPAELCERILQSEETSVVLEPDLSKECYSKQSLLQNNLLKAKKGLLSNKKHNSNDVITYGQEHSPEYLYESKSQSENPAVVSESDPPKANCSENSLLNGNQLKKRKLQHNSKELKNNERNYHGQKCSTANLCESSTQSQDTLVVLESNISKEYCSQKILLGSNPCKKKKPRSNSKVLKKNAMYNDVKKNFPANLTEKTAQSKDYSVALKSKPIKSYCPNKKLIACNQLKKGKPRCKSKGVINNPDPTYSLPYLCERTSESGDISVSSKSDLKNKYCSKNSTLTKQLFRSKKRQHNNKGSKKNGRDNHDHRPANLFESTFQYEDYSVVSESNSLKLCFSKNSSSENNSLKKDKPLCIDKLFISNELSQIDQENSSVYYDDSTLITEDTTIDSKSDPLKKSGFKNRLLENDQLKNHELLHNEKELKNNEVSDYSQGNSPVSDYSQGNSPVSDYSQGNSPSYIDDSIPQDEEISVATESDPSVEYIPKNCSLQKGPLINEELHHSDTDFIRIEPNNHNSIKEISFIECNLSLNDPNHGNTFGFIHGEIDSHQTTTEEDPLECHSTELDHLEFNPKEIDSKDYLLKTDVLNNSLKVIKLCNSSEDDSVDCDLYLECNSEDTEPLEPDFQHTDCNLKESDVLERDMFPCDIKKIQSLKCSSDAVTMLLSNLEVTSETATAEDDHAETKNITNIANTNQLDIDSEKVTSKDSQMNCNQTKCDSESFYKEAGENQTKEDTVLHCLKPASNLLGLEESSSQMVCIEEGRKQNNLLVGHENKSEVHVALENSSEVEPPLEYLSSEKIDLKHELMETSQQKNLSTKGSAVSTKTEYLETDQSEIGLPLIKAASDHGDNEKNKYDNGENTFNDLDGNKFSENYNRSTPELLPTDGTIGVSKESLDFHEKRVLKVLLRRLEDEEIFQVWKKGGVVPLLELSRSRTTLKQKQTCLLGRSKRPSRRAKKYKCQVCKKCFFNRERYWEHRASKCGRVKVFGCGNCNRKYVLRKMLDEHRAKCISIKYYRCNTCLKLFYSQERLDEHNASKCDTQKAFHCDVCSRGFIYRRLLLIHKTPICVSLRRYKCSICHQSFHKSDLKTHKIKEHGIGLPQVILCDCCGKLVSRKHFNIHMTTHFDSQAYRCKVCSKIFKTKEARHHHEQCHPETKPCICEDCGKSFKKLKNLKKHVSCSNNSVKCKACGKLIQNKCCFRDHLKRHIKVEERIEDALKYEIKQEPCDEEYSQCTVDEKPFKCSECEEIFSDRSTMEHHLHSIHQIPLPLQGPETKTGQYLDSLLDTTKPFKCEKCNICYLKRNDLDQHLQKFHDALDGIRPITEDKPFKCEKCNMCFSRKDYLNRHCRRVHNAPTFVRAIVVKTPTPERPHSCNICGTCFTDKKNLSRHRSRAHSARYPCTFCKEKFKTDTLLKAHTFEHFKDCFSVCTTVKQEEKLIVSTEVNAVKETPTQERPYACDICGNCFAEKKNLSRHRSRMHSNKTNSLLKEHTSEHFKDFLSGSTSIKKEVEPSASICIKEVKTPTQERPYACEICGNCFAEKKNLSRHRSRMHSNKTNSLLKEHTSEHFKDFLSGSTSIKKEVEPSASICIKEVKTPTQERPYACEICGNCFAEKKNLSRHRSRVHPLSLNKEQFKSGLKDHTLKHVKDEVSVSTNIKQEEILISSTDVKEEERNLFANDVFIQPANELTNFDSEKGDNVYDSKEFRESLSREASLEKNPMVARDLKSKVHVCRECGKSFNTAHSQKRHVCLHKLRALQSTTGREPHTCKVCGVFFFEKWKLNRHLLSHNSQTFKCYICNKTFTTQLKLSLHLLVHGIKNIAEPTFKCSTCNKLFPSRENLESHSILHTPQNPHQCTKCDKKFTTRFSLKRHNDSLHPDKRFSCNYCKMAFVSFSSLNQHVMYVHKKTVSLTEYVLKIDDDMQDDTPMEAEYPFINNIQDEGTAEINVQPQVFSNLSNMFMFDSGEGAVNTNEIIPGLAGQIEGASSLEVLVKIEDW